jgi:hypothetical protein
MHIREVELRRLAHDRIETGELPLVRLGPTRYGQGSGKPCALCGAQFYSQRSNAICLVNCVRGPSTFIWHATLFG